MKEFSISNKGSARIFKNRILERLTRTHFIFPVLLFYSGSALSVAAGLQYSGLPWWEMLYMFPVGWLVFTLVEYAIHRFLFHFEATTEKQKKLKRSIHGVHHEYPRDKDRLVMPPLISLALALFFFLLFKWIVLEAVWYVYAGFLSGYSTYLIIHYAIHRYRPPRNFLGYLWKHHSLHHYYSDEAAFSVSFPLWDWFFGTMPERNSGSKQSPPE